METVVDRRPYIVVFIALVGLTLLTIGLAKVDLGAWHGLVGLTIAAIKGGLVLVFFMHVFRGNRLSFLVVLIGVFWLTILLVLTSADYATRQALLADRSIDTKEDINR